MELDSSWIRKNVPKSKGLKIETLKLNFAFEKSPPENKNVKSQDEEVLLKRRNHPTIVNKECKWLQSM